jgi:hypothetical protein
MLNADLYMKTLTEFAGVTLKNAAKTKQDLLASGKTAEELPQAFGEAMKLEGDRLNLMMTALEIVGSKLNDLKRVIVHTLNEGEKAPANVVQKENHTFSVEYYPSLEKKETRHVSNEDSPRDDKKKGKKGRGRRDRDGGGGGRRSPQAPQGGRPPREGQKAAPKPHTGPRGVITPVAKSAPAAAPTPAESETSSN